ncbi:MAG TPA: S8 family serine peptidase [Longimicrobiaceae bacterium]|nr:S8 family serine peptidase [Longimicrobiaceae bacterium]
MPRVPRQNGAAQQDAPRELVVVARDGAGLRARTGGLEVASVGDADVAPLGRLLQSAGVRLVPLFGASEERVLRAREAVADATGATPPDLSIFYRVEAPDAQLDELAEALRDQDAVEAAFVKPPAVPAVLDELNDMAPAADEAPPATADFTARQTYLDAAPAGVDARWAWTQPGGGGGDVRIIDVEGAWRFTHEDLLQGHGGVVGGTQIADVGWRNHGTAVAGVFSGDRNGFGITGICPDAVVSAVSFSPYGSAWAIRQAADRLRPGDVLLIELHRPGPRFNFQSPQGQRGYVALEWWPDDFQAIQYAVSRGVIVVEAAGNGSENLDDAIYDTNPASPYGPFPSWWRNPFRRSPLDSGAIVVGAGAPPPGTHGTNAWGPDRSRLDFSNYGRLVDAQGYGREVTTAGYGDLQGGTNEDLWYTDRFSGTSSASPIVVGSIGAVQGVLKARGRSPLTPSQARDLLRATGSPQQDGLAGPATQRIGSRPSIRQMVERLTSTVQTVPLYRYWNAGIGDHFYTTNWNELGSGRHGWAYEGVQCFVLSQPRTGSAPLYRYWNAASGDHFYTTSWGELGSGRYGYAYEGIQCYVPVQAQSGTVPVYRYWNPGIADHFYTTSWAELGSGRYGWGYEGVQCHAWPSAVTLTPVAGTPEAAGEPAAVEALAGSAPEPAGAAGAVAGMPSTFHMGVPGSAPEEEEATAPSFAAAPVARQPAEGGGSFTVPFPTGLRRTNGSGGRSRPVTVSFTVGGDDEE